jgi:hypothetical protein
VVEEELDLTGREGELKYNINWRNRSKITLEIERGYVKLLSFLDPTNSGGETLPTGKEYNGNE